MFALLLNRCRNGSWTSSVDAELSCRWTWWWIWKVVTCWLRKQIVESLWACWRRCCWLMQRRESPRWKLSVTPLWRCNTCWTSPTATSESSLPLKTSLQSDFTARLNSPCRCFASSVKSCFHIMDICWSRSSAYEVTNRNKGPFVRPVTTTAAATVNHPFNKVAGVHAQVR